MPRKQFIAIATPSLGQVSIQWSRAFRSLGFPLNVGEVNDFVIDSVGGEIAECRNQCVARAMAFEKPDCEVSHVFWIDDDVLFTYRALLTLYYHRRDIASGVYFTKCEPSEPLIFPGRGCGTTQFIPNQTFETWGHGMGLTLIRTEVYRRMATELNLPKDKYGHTEWYKTTGFEHSKVEEDVRWLGGTEDLYFLDNAGKMGIKPLVDTSMGAFGWHYDRHSGKGYPVKQWNQYVLGQPIVWPTPDGDVIWNR